LKNSFNNGIKIVLQWWAVTGNKETTIYVSRVGGNQKELNSAVENSTQCGDRNELFQNTMAEVTQIGETTARSGKVVARLETEMVRLKFISLRLFLYFALFALLKKK
jgi:hypothetical protein